MTCRKEILKCAKELVAQRSIKEFTLMEVIKCMERKGSRYEESTIRTHIASKMCASAPDHHQTTHKDFVGVGDGVYRFY